MGKLWYLVKEARGETKVNTPPPPPSYQTSGSVEEEQDEAAVGTHHSGVEHSQLPPPQWKKNVVIIKNIIKLPHGGLSPPSGRGSSCSAGSLSADARSHIQEAGARLPPTNQANLWKPLSSACSFLLVPLWAHVRGGGNPFTGGSFHPFKEK